MLTSLPGSAQLLAPSRECHQHVSLLDGGSQLTWGLGVISPTERPLCSLISVSPTT